MILKIADIKKLGVSKILIWSLDITNQNFKKCMPDKSCRKEPKYSSFCYGNGNNRLKVLKLQKNCPLTLLGWPFIQ
jgi:hypothetical protein